MKRIVFLLEEYSMKVLLEGLLPLLFPGLPFLCVTHDGKQHLDKSISRQLQAWREPGVRFVVLRDTDGADCRELKARLVAACRAAGREDTLVRLVCQELEAWYLGDPVALADAFSDPALRTIAQRARFRDPDAVAQPSRALEELAPSFQKVSGARAMASRLDVERTASHSFRAFVAGVRRLAEQMQ